MPVRPAGLVAIRLHIRQLLKEKLFINGGAEYPHVGQVPVPLRVVQSVADDKGVRRDEPVIIRGDIRFPAMGFIQKSTDSYAAGVPGGQSFF